MLGVKNVFTQDRAYSCILCSNVLLISSLFLCCAKRCCVKRWSEDLHQGLKSMTCCPCDTVLPDLSFLICKMEVTIFRLPGPGLCCCEAWRGESRHRHVRGATEPLQTARSLSLCWQEEDDYESPNDDQDGEDDGDYESPNEEEEAPVEDDADYEPPPSNDEEALQNSILPAKPFPNSNSMYIDRPLSGKAPQQPPVPPQRPMAALPPPPAGRNHSPLPPPQTNHEEPRSRNHKTAKLPAPSIDRSTKPPLDRSLAPFDREPFTLGKKPPFADKPSIPAGRLLGENLPKIQKPPLPPTTERHERSSPLPGKKPPVPKHGWGPDRRENVSIKSHQRPLPQPALLPMSSNTYPSRSAKPSPKHSLPSSHMSGAFSESNSSFPQSASLPPYFPQGPSNRPPLRAEGRNFPLPLPNKPPPPSPAEEENSLNEEWYVSYITRPEAEAALRKINQQFSVVVAHLNHLESS
ncbi:lymphocyte cytosolic protein 2 isoform X3 [Saimiri boliviensis]|uniref:lymphocyte cytosolic protein 2 isoform X3 n=1 Tax=Saimiri boliviensis TaxID=27679 RepID=UPI003D77BC33